MKTGQQPYSAHVSMLDGYYIVSERAGFVAYEQERGSRFHEARFETLHAAEQ